MEIFVLVVLLVVAGILGFAVWGFVSFVVWLTGGSRRRPRTICPSCRQPTPADLARCDWCGRSLAGPVRGEATELANLAVMERQLFRMKAAGVLTSDETDSLLGRVTQYRARLMGLAPRGEPAEGVRVEVVEEPAAVKQPVARPPVEPRAPVAPRPAGEPPREPAPLAPPRPRPAGPPRERTVEPLWPPERPQPATPPAPAASSVQPESAQRPRPAPRPQAAPHPAAPVAPVAPVVKRPAPPAAPVRPAEPRKPWTEMLSAFMEDRNIRIGELVGGLLFVVFSVLLTISLWKQIEKIPYSPFFIVVAVSAAVFGVGLYAHHRWKLESTSMSLLAVATLLVPLDFFVMVRVAEDETMVIAAVAGLVSLGLFAWLVYQAARVLVPAGPWHQTAAVLGNSAALLVFGRAIGAESPAGHFLAACGLPALCFAGGVGAYLWRLPKRRLDAAGAGAMFMLLGTAAFATTVSWGLLIAQAAGMGGGGVAVSLDALAVALDRLAVWIVPAGATVLAAGLTVMRGTTRDKPLAAYRTAGTAVALAGGVLLLAALGLAWPMPGQMTVVGLLGAAALLVAAFHYRLPLLHVGVIALATTAYLTGYHFLSSYSHLAQLTRDELARDMVQRLLHALSGTGSARSGTALVGLCAALGVAGEMLARGGWRRHGLVYARGAAVVAVLSVSLVTLPGLLRGEDAVRTAIVYGIYGAGSLALNVRWRNLAVSYLGLSLLVGATCFAMRTAGGPEVFWAVVLAEVSLVMALVAAALGRLAGRADSSGSPSGGPLAASRRWGLSAFPADVYRLPLLHVAEAVAVAAVGLAVWTAWRDRAAILAVGTPLVAMAAACAAAAWFLLAWMHRTPERTWTASMVVLAGLLHALTCNDTGWTALPWPVGLLAHATLAVGAAAALDWLVARRKADDFVQAVRRVLSEPLGQTAILSSAIAVPAVLLTWGPAVGLTWLAACLFWLAGVWLVIGVSRRSAGMISAHQAACAAAVAAATLAWLERQTWAVPLSVNPLHPWTLQACGAALAAFCLVWLGLRIALRRSPLARQLLEPEWPAVDWVLLHVLTVAQLAALVPPLLEGVYLELVRPGAMSATSAAAFSPGAWLLLGVLGAAMALSLWRRWGKAELVSTLLVLAAAPCLVAGQMAGRLAAASALRWGLGLVFLLASAAVWQRTTLRAWAAAARANLALPGYAARLARGTLVGVSAAPVIVLTLAAALLQLVGVAAAWPHAIHPAASYLVPLLMVMGGMVGYALRDRSAGYAFSAGLVADMAVVLGYALAVVMSGGAFGARESAIALQLATIAASAWAGIWLAARRWVDVWREAGPRGAGARALMDVQIAMPFVGNVALLVPALFILALVLPHASDVWPRAAGGPLGWVALAGLTGAAVYRRLQAGRRVRPETAGLMGMAVLGLLACTVQALLPQTPWGFRTLMLGWAAFALFVAAAAWWVATVRTLPGAEGPPQALLRAAALWVGLAGGLAVLLGLKAAAWHPYDDLLWAAAAIAVASAAGATMGYWRRAEGWAFTSALGVNLAASLVVWHFRWRAGLSVALPDWWMLLVQANVIATAAVALVWLAARRRLYQLREMSVRTSPLLGLQTALAVTGMTVLVALPVARLLAMPRWLPYWAGRAADPAGWIALALVAAATTGYLRQTAPRQLFHVAGALAMALPVMLACLTAEGRLPYDLGPWVSYHALLTALAVAGLALLGGAMLAARAGQAFQPDASDRDAGRESKGAGVRLESLTCGAMVQGWVTWIGAAVVALAVLWSQHDPDGLWLRARAVLATALAAGILATWLRLPWYVFLSGLLVNVAGTLVWSMVGPDTLLGLVETNVLCLAAGAVLWTAVKPLCREGVPSPVLGDRPIPFSHAAAVAALAAMLAVAGWIVVQDLSGEPLAPMDWLAWASLAGVAAALIAGLWDRAARFPLPGLYLLGLAGIGLAWHARAFAPREIVWAAATELAGFAVGAAALGWLLPRARPAWRLLRIPSEDGRFPAGWFEQLQAVVALCGAVLCAWVALDFGFDGMIEGQAVLGLTGRLAAMPGALMLLGAAVVMAARRDESLIPPATWRYAGFGAGLLLQCSAGWSLLDPSLAAPWLHRSVTLMVAAAMMTLLSGVGLARIVPSAVDWAASGRRMATWFGGLALAALVAVLVQEGMLYDREVGPLALWEVLVVAAALVGLIGACIAFAVAPGLDRFGLSERGRTAYVYAAEGLLLLLCLHVRLTLPELFGSGFFRRHWMLIVMAVAYAGAGLSELFHRRRLPVLSVPLERTAFVLPIAIAVGFWFQPEALGGLPGLSGPTPAVWFLVGAFYAACAWLGRPAGTALPSGLAVLAFNLGLWVVWERVGIGFFDHPQLWLIPVGLCVLAAEHLNHGRLTAAQSGATRYLALSLVYVSSTADMYMAGIGRSVVLPLVLMFLSVAGVLLGILLRVRSFLVLGLTFLLVLAATMLKYTAFDRDQIWVLYACGVATGAAIIALFAVFEKRRNDVMRAVEKFKQWQR